MNEVDYLLNLYKGVDEELKAVKSTETAPEASPSRVWRIRFEGIIPTVKDKMDAKVQQSSIPSEAASMKESRQDLPLRSEGGYDETADVGSKGVPAGSGSENDEWEKLGHDVGTTPVETEKLNGKVDVKDSQVERYDVGQDHSGIGGERGVQERGNRISKIRDADVLDGEGANADEKTSEKEKLEQDDLKAELVKVDDADKPAQLTDDTAQKGEKGIEAVEREGGVLLDAREVEKDVDAGKVEQEEKSEEGKKEKKEKKVKSEGEKKEKKEKKERKEKKENGEEGNLKQQNKDGEQKEKKEKKEKVKKEKKLRSEKIQQKLDKLNAKMERILYKVEEKRLQLREALEKELQGLAGKQQSTQDGALKKDRQESEKGATAPQRSSSKKDLPPVSHKRTPSGLRREDTVLPEELRSHLEGAQHSASEKQMDRKPSGSLSRTATVYPSQLDGEDQLGLGELPGSQLKDGYDDVPVDSNTKDVHHNWTDDHTEVELETNGGVSAEKSSENMREKNENIQKHHDSHLNTRLYPEVAAA